MGEEGWESERIKERYVKGHGIGLGVKGLGAKGLRFIVQGSGSRIEVLG